MACEKIPLLFIQCDWNSILSDVGAEAWVSVKVKDSPGTHGRIKTVKSLPDPSVTISVGFFVERLISPTAIVIGHHESSFTTLFLAPFRTFSDIHKASIACFDVNDESLAVSYSSKSSSLLVWNTRTEEKKISLDGHVFEVYKCKFFPSGKVILSCGSDMTLRIWCSRTGICPVVLKGHTMAVTDFDFVNRGKNIISTSKDGSVKLWNCGNAAFIADVAKVTSSINCCKVLDAPSYIDLGSREEPEDPREIDTYGKLVIYGCEDGSVECIAIQTRKVIFSIQVESAVNCIAIMSEDQFVFGCQNGQVYFCNLKNIDNKNISHESNSSVLSLLPFKNYGVFVTRADGTVIFIPLNDSAKRISLTGSNCDPIYDIASDETCIYTCCRDGIVRSYKIDCILDYCSF